MVKGIVIKQVAGNLEITTVVRASRPGICSFKKTEDVIEQTQGTLVIADDLNEGDFVVSVMTAVSKSTGKTIREKTSVIFPEGVDAVEEASITLPNGTVVGKDSGVAVV